MVRIDATGGGGALCLEPAEFPRSRQLHPVVATSEDELPLDPDFAAELLEWKLESEMRAKEEGKTQLTGLDLLFPSTATGRHFHTAPIQQDYIRPAGCCLVACPKCGAAAGVWCQQDGLTPNGKRLPLHEERWAAAGKYGSVGWHTFRHT